MADPRRPVRLNLWSAPVRRLVVLDLGARNSDGWRGWLARQLRRAARRVDGNTTLILYFDTDPVLDVDDRDAVIDAGVAAMKRSALQLLRAQAVDEVMREQLPWLFADKAR